MLKIARTFTLLVVCLFAPRVQAADFPNRPITVIVPFDAGGSVDTIARLLAEKMQADLGQPVIIENRGGGGGIIAFEDVVHSKPDGYKLLLCASSYTSIAALHNLPFDPIKDITPISLLNTGPLVLTVSANTPAKNLKEFVALLKSKPGSLNFGSPGVGSGAEFAAFLFEKATATSMVHVQYKSDQLVLQALLSGEVQVDMASGPALTPMLQSGKMRALGVTSGSRWPTMPDLPSVTEVAPGAEHIAWNGVWGPAGMPQDIVNRLNQAFKHAVESPDIQQRLRADIREPTTSTPEEFGRQISHEVVEFKALVKAANIKVQ